MPVKKAEKHGPFDEYTEVHTDHGWFGLHPGQVLTEKDGVTVIEGDLPTLGDLVPAPEAAESE